MNFPTALGTHHQYLPMLPRRRRTFGHQRLALPCLALVVLLTLAYLPGQAATVSTNLAGPTAPGPLPSWANATTKAYQISLARNLRLVHPALEDEIAERRITDVLQDSHGFIWVGTEDGLYRYDGNRTLRFSYSRSDARSLAHDQVNVLYEDGNGRLWVGTKGGLNQYLGPNLGFSQIDLLPNPAGADGANSTRANIDVRAIEGDAAQALWVGTKNHGLFEWHQGQARQFLPDPDNPQSLPVRQVNTILEDLRGNLWVGTAGGGISRFDKRGETFISYQTNSNNPQSLTSNQVTRLYEDPQERLWVATFGGGVNLFDRERQTFSAYRHNPDNAHSLASDTVNDVLLDLKGTLWIATDTGLSELRDDGQFANYHHRPADNTSLSSDEVERLHLDADGVLWLATGAGLDRWNYLSNAFTYVSMQNQQLRSNRVTAVTEGNDNSLWIGTKSAGLSRLDRKSQTRTFYSLENAADIGLTDNRITALHTTASGNIWVGTRSGGALRWRAEVGRFESLVEIAALGAVDTLAAAPTETPAAALTTTTTTTPAATPAATSAAMSDASVDPLARWGARVSAISGGGEGRVWVGTRGSGLLLIQDNRVQQFQQQADQSNSLSDNQVISVYEEPGGILWVGTKGGGLNRFDIATQEFTQVPLESDRGSHAALDILASKDGTLWVGTAGGGLLRWNAADRAANNLTLTHLSKQHGLRSNTVRGILEDQQGTLWLSTNRGISRLDPNSGLTRHFDRFNGLRGDSFYTGAKSHGRSGRLYFGSNAGLVGFYANTITQLHQPPRIALQAGSRKELLGRVFNTGAERSLELALDHNNTYINFRFAALTYVSPDQNRYLYKLHGFDTDWIDPEDTLMAAYTSLPAGRYEFQVRAANPESVWSEQPASIKLVVSDPPWLSIGAKIAYGFALFALIGFFLARLQLELQRTRSSRRTLEAQVELRTIELEERNRQLVELNDKLQEASITDPLTGLLNRRSFYEFVSREVASVERSFTSANGVADANRRHLFFMMIDLDGFKPINDTFGHHTGDHTLVQVSELLTSCAREADTVFRWGGDEFLVIGQVQQSADLEVLAERFRATIDEHRFDPKYGKALRLTASVGVAPYPFSESNPGVATWEQVADVADLSAYLAKTHGKNAWVCARGTDELTTQALQQLKDNLDLLIESGMVDAASSSTETPIPGANQR